MCGVEGKRRPNKVPGFYPNNYKDSQLDKMAQLSDGHMLVLGGIGEGRELDPSGDEQRQLSSYMRHHLKTKTWDSKRVQRLDC